MKGNAKAQLRRIVNSALQFRRVLQDAETPFGADAIRARRLLSHLWQLPGAPQQGITPHP
jgi:hypothetical protein